MIINSKKKKS